MTPLLWMAVPFLIWGGFWMAQAIGLSIFNKGRENALVVLVLASKGLPGIAIGVGIVFLQFIIWGILYAGGW